MSQLDLNGFRKRKRGEKVFKFKVFGARGYPAGFNGSFQENVRALLEFGQIESGGMASWSFQLEARRHPLLQLLLFVVEEPIHLSLDFSCKHCHYIGWGHHMICNKNYHFMLPSKAEYDKSSINAMELQRENYSLHGVFHSNGFGHLLCINGSEKGSPLPGYQIMDFWDRLCSGLGAREVSLRDEAKKKGMELRLVHCVGYSRPWFGQWDYVLRRGSYGVNQEMHQNAIKTIQNIPLSTLLINNNSDHEMIQRYQLLSGHSLMTLGDLFHFMLDLKSRIPKETTSTYPTIMSDASCRWSPKRVDKAIHVVVEALKRADFQWVSRQHVRDVARAYIGDTGLLDFVLKSLGNHMVGTYLVRRCLNPVTKVLEYCLEDVSSSTPNFNSYNFHPPPPPPPPPLIQPKFHHHISWPQLIKDLLYIYNNILLHNGGIPLASRIILDSKHLAKDYHGEPTANDQTNKRKIYCRVILQLQLQQGASAGAGDKAAAYTPYHCFLLRNSATFDELRCEVEKTFRETYLSLRNMAADSIKNMSPLRSDTVFKTVKPGSKITFVCVQGIEGKGVYPAVVNCICGTKDEDGERMVSCDLCRVWQHTRCVQIPDHHAIPNIFLCNACEQDILRFRCYPPSYPSNSMHAP